jgi:Zn-dependent membrane protease YugP
VLLSLWASSNVNSTFKKYSKQLSSRRLTGAEAAQRVLSANGVRGVRIDRVSGNLTDHFDPRTNVIRLSDSVYSSTSTAAIGVACHEAGHAVQHAKGYFPIKVRMAIIPMTKFGSALAMPIFFIGLLLAAPALLSFGILLYAAVAFFQLVTLPVEFNASARALEAIKTSGMFDKEEHKAAKKVLTAAAMTYVAALASSLLTLLRLVILAGGGRRRN